MADFPAIVPTVRAIGFGEYATKKFQQIAGNVTTRIYAKFANNIPITLEFGGEAGVPDAQAALIYQAWTDCLGDRVAIALSDQLLSGMDPALRARIPTAMSFYFVDEEPSLTDAVPGRKRVAFKLEGRFSSRHVP